MLIGLSNSLRLLKDLKSHNLSQKAYSSFSADSIYMIPVTSSNPLGMCLATYYGLSLRLESLSNVRTANGRIVLRMVHSR